MQYLLMLYRLLSVTRDGRSFLRTQYSPIFINFHRTRIFFLFNNIRIQDRTELIATRALIYMKGAIFYF